MEVEFRYLHRPKEGSISRVVNVKCGARVEDMKSRLHARALAEWSRVNQETVSDYMTRGELKPGVTYDVASKNPGRTLRWFLNS